MNTIQLSNDILIDANKLRYNNLQKQALTEYIVEILRSIKEELQKAHREGLLEISTTMPETFIVPSMNNSDSQRIIWATVMEKLIEKNYRVKWEPAKGRIHLRITWLTKDDEITIRRQMDLLNKLKDNHK